MAIFPSAVSTDSDLYVAVNQKTTQLTDNPLSNVATTANVVSTTGFPAVGFISIDTEIIKYTGTTATSFTGLTRGQDGSTAAVHAQNSQVYHNVIAAHHNVLKDEVKAIEQNLSDRFGLSSTQSLAPLGSAGGPSYSFTGDGNTGMYSATANRINWATDGSSRMSLDSSFLDIAAAQVTIPSGSATSPSLSFSSESDTGMYLSNTNRVGFATSGILRAEISDSGHLIPGAAASYSLGVAGLGWKALYVENGTVALPSMSFQNDPDTGLFTGGPGRIDFSNNGVNTVTIDSGGTITCAESIREKDGSPGAPSYTFTNDIDTGIYTSGAGSINFTTNGVARASIDTVALYTNLQLIGKGTATNDSAAAGFIGEVVSSTVAGASAVTVTTTGQYVNITSISLTAGDWDVVGQIGFTANSATITGGQNGAISAFSANTTTDHVTGDNVLPTVRPTSTEDTSVHITWRVSISATATYYLKGVQSFSAGSPQVFGKIFARRVR